MSISKMNRKLTPETPGLACNVELHVYREIQHAACNIDLKTSCLNLDLGGQQLGNSLENIFVKICIKKTE